MTQLTSRGSTPTSSRAVIPIVATTVLLSGFDLFVVNVVLAQIADDLNVADLSGLSWILNAYTIAFAAFLIPAGRLSDRIGSHRALVVGLALFAITSAGCAFSTSLTALIVMRTLQGASAALMTPSSLGVVLEGTSPDKRAGAVRLWAALGGLGAALGPVVGGGLAEFGWRWVFLINIPIAGVAAVATWFLVARSTPRREHHLGLIQSTVLAGSIAALVAALVNGGEWGWTSAQTAILAVIALTGFASTGLTSAFGRRPILEPQLLRVPRIIPAAAALLVFHIAFGAMLLTVILWMEAVWDWSPLRAGLGIAPGPAIVPIVAVLAGRLTGRISPQGLAGLGGAVFAVGAASWALAVQADSTYAAAILPGALLTGVGVGLITPTAMAIGTSALPAQWFATGSGVLSMARQVGIAVGVAVAVACLGPASDVSDFHLTWWVTAAVSLIAGAPLLAVAKENRE
ncbi:MFS transporter [Gordonia malaquae]|uniref:MFS transporter n=1 Tax=Gordonia malaquae TaxID=410332 RepID=UPI0030189B79